MSPKQKMPAPEASSSKTTTPLPDSFSQPQAKKAVDALLAHHAKVVAEREETEFIPKEDHVWLIVNTKRGTTKRKIMPKRIQLPHPPLPPPPITAVGLITKPPQRQYKDLLVSPEHNIKFINRVVDTDKLRGKWKPFEARRNLMKENDIWLADERIVPSLSKLLGKTFFDAKKTPIPVNLKRKDLKAELGRAINSTYFHPSTGTSHSVRIATPPTSTAAHTLDNLLAALPPVIALIEDGWDNVLSVGIKTSSSVLLPVWNSSLEGRFKEQTKVAKSSVATEAVAPDESEVADRKQKRKSDVVDVPAKKTKVKDTSEVKEPKASTETIKVSSEPISKTDKITKKAGKKSSSVGTGGAGKKAKTAIVGTA